MTTPTPVAIIPSPKVHADLLAYVLTYIADVEGTYDHIRLTGTEVGLAVTFQPPGPDPEPSVLAGPWEHVASFPIRPGVGARVSALVEQLINDAPGSPAAPEREPRLHLVDTPNESGPKLERIERRDDAPGLEGLGVLGVVRVTTEIVSYLETATDAGVLEEDLLNAVCDITGQLPFNVATTLRRMHADGDVVMWRTTGPDADEVERWALTPGPTELHLDVIDETAADVAGPDVGAGDPSSSGSPAATVPDTATTQAESGTALTDDEDLTEGLDTFARLLSGGSVPGEAGEHRPFVPADWPPDPDELQGAITATAPAAPLQPANECDQCGATLAHVAGPGDYRATWCPTCDADQLAAEEFATDLEQHLIDAAPEIPPTADAGDGPTSDDEPAPSTDEENDAESSAPMPAPGDDSVHVAPGASDHDQVDDVDVDELAEDLDFIGDPIGAQRALDVANGMTACRRCGCTQNSACEGGCAWAEPDLCTACAAELDRDQEPAPAPAVLAAVPAELTKAVIDYLKVQPASWRTIWIHLDHSSIETTGPELTQLLDQLVDEGAVSFNGESYSIDEDSFPIDEDDDVEDLDDVTAPLEECQPETPAEASADPEPEPEPVVEPAAKARRIGRPPKVSDEQIIDWLRRHGPTTLAAIVAGVSLNRQPRKRLEQLRDRGLIGCTDDDRWYFGIPPAATAPADPLDDDELVALVAQHRNGVEAHTIHAALPWATRTRVEGHEVNQRLLLLVDAGRLRKTRGLFTAA